MSPRPVSVTITGTATPLLQGNALRVTYANGGQMIVDTTNPDVVVKYLEPPREWTNGDVALIDGAAWARFEDDYWLAPCQRDYRHDSDIQQALDEGRAQLLRYQAGGDK